LIETGPLFLPNFANAREARNAYRPLVVILIEYPPYPSIFDRDNNLFIIALRRGESNIKYGISIMENLFSENLFSGQKWCTVYP